jgi:hypothetical protein
MTRATNCAKLTSVQTLYALLGLTVWVGVFSLFPGWVAKRKGYSFALYAILGLFLFVFGLIIVALLPTKKEAAPSTT